jgi:uncharacterized protein YndB with AHSA1/START domain
MHESSGPGANAPVVKEIHIDAPPEIVYEYLTQADKIVQWMGFDVDVDPQPGGIFRLSPNRVDVVRGEYVEATPYSKVAFSWGFEGAGHELPAGSTLVEFSLERAPSGTRLRLVHSGIADPEWREDHSVGWDHYLPRIAAAAEGFPLGPDPWASKIQLR